MGSVVTVLCDYCGKEVSKPLKEYNRSMRKSGNNSVFYCARACKGKAESKKPVSSVCEYCENQHEGTYASGRFCNVSCARGFATADNRLEISAKVKQTLAGRNVNLEAITNVLSSEEWSALKVCGLNSYNTASNGKYICPCCGNKFSKYGIANHVWRLHTEEGRKSMCGENHPRTGTIGSSWSKGLTKETDVRVRRLSKKVSKTLKGVNSYNKLSAEAKEIRNNKLSEAMKLAHREGRACNIGQFRWLKEPSYPEKFFMSVIENNMEDKNYTREHRVGTFIIDFAWEHKMLAIEIDGEQHYRTQENIDRDKRKDAYLTSLGWKVFRVRWKDMSANTKHWIECCKREVDGCVVATLV